MKKLLFDMTKVEDMSLAVSEIINRDKDKPLTEFERNFVLNLDTRRTYQPPITNKNSPLYYSLLNDDGFDDDLDMLLRIAGEENEYGL